MEMEKRLYEASLEGNVTTLKALIQEDPLILDRITPTFFQDTPLHIATLHGHLEFTRAVLSHNPRLATESDSLGHLPLHIASANGHVEIVGELVRVDPSSCLVRSKDGMLPLHLGIMKRVRVEIVTELTRACPESTRLRADRGHTVLHFCVEYDNLDAFQVLVEMIRGENDGSNDLLNAKNDDGNTAFHLAALHKNLEMTKFLLSTPGLEVITVNNNGLTPLDLVQNSPKDSQALKLLNLLLQYNVQNSTTINHNSSPPPTKSHPPSKNNPWKTFFTFNNSNINHIEHLKGELLIIAAIITAINALPTIYLRINEPELLVDVYSINSGSFVPAVAVIVVLLGGFPLKNKLCAWLVVQLMYTAIGFFGLGYIGAMLSFEGRYSKLDVALVLMLIWFVLLMILSAVNVIRLIVLIVKSIKGCVKQRRLRNNEGTRNDLSNS